jgi:hypothetical protein
MSNPDRDPLFGAAVLKLSMAKQGMSSAPGFRSIYAGTLKDLGVTDAEVDAYISAHRERLLAHLETPKRGA